MDDLHHPAAPTAVIGADQIEVGVDLCPGWTCADAQDEAAAGQRIHGGGLLGELSRVAHRGQQHRRADIDALGGRRYARQHRERLRSRLGEQGIADPHGVEAKLFRSHGPMDKSAGIAVVRRIHRQLSRGQQQSEGD